jgi:hypothetical protein
MAGRAEFLRIQLPLLGAQKNDPPVSCRYRRVTLCEFLPKGRTQLLTKAFEKSRRADFSGFYTRRFKHDGPSALKGHRWGEGCRQPTSISYTSAAQESRLSRTETKRIAEVVNSATARARREKPAVNGKKAGQQRKWSSEFILPTFGSARSANTFSRKEFRRSARSTRIT